MFRRSKVARQAELFDDMLSVLSEGKRQKALASREFRFYREVYRQLDEAPFAVLYEGQGRPNVPVRVLVGALILRQLYGWTYRELFDRVDFDVLARLALGQTGFGESPFCPASLFNFMTRLSDHHRATGENLLEGAFQLLGGGWRQRFSVSGEVQRCDSFLALSNIGRYSRLQLLIELIRRLARALPEAAQKRLPAITAPYLEGTSGHYVYELEEGAVPGELAKLGPLIADLLGGFAEFADLAAYELLERAFGEHFEIVDGAVRPRPAKTLSTGSLQAPDDSDAAFSGKYGQARRGQVANVTETCTPGNPLNLLTDLAVEPANTADGPLLEGRVETLKEQTPELAELHTDGGYGGPALDATTEACGVNHIETGSRAGHGPVVFDYSREDEQSPWRITCPHGQTVTAEPVTRRFRAVFKVAGCAGCPLAASCPAKLNKAGDRRTWFFKLEWAKGNLRRVRIKALPLERRKLRANVEATVKQFTTCYNQEGKLPVRGRFRTALVLFARACAINFARVDRYLRSPAGRKAFPAAFPTLASALANLLQALRHQRPPAPTQTTRHPATIFTPQRFRRPPAGHLEISGQIVQRPAC